MWGRRVCRAPREAPVRRGCRVLRARPARKGRWEQWGLLVRLG